MNFFSVRSLNTIIKHSKLLLFAVKVSKQKRFFAHTRARGQRFSTPLDSPCKTGLTCFRILLCNKKVKQKCTKYFLALRMCKKFICVCVCVNSSYLSIFVSFVCVLNTTALWQLLEGNTTNTSKAEKLNASMYRKVAKVYCIVTDLRAREPFQIYNRTLKRTKFECNFILYEV